MAKVNNLENFANLVAFKLKQDINTLLHNNISEMIKDKIADSAEAMVYNTFSPEYYDRRYTLSDKQYMQQTNGDLQLTINPMPPFNPDLPQEFHRFLGTTSANSGNQLVGLISGGDGWNGYRYDVARHAEEHNKTPNYAYTRPRPYVDKVKEDLGRGELVASLISELRAMGYKITDVSASAASALVKKNSKKRKK